MVPISNPAETPDLFPPMAQRRARLDPWELSCLAILVLHFLAASF